MKVLWKAIAGIGIVLLFLGVASFGSQSLVLPVTMIVSGAAMVYASAGWEKEWTEK